MSERGKQLLQAVLELPREEQEWFADELFANLDEMTEEEFRAELRRRREEYERDPSVAESWEEVLKSIE